MACGLNNCHSFGLTNLGDHSKWPPRLGLCETFVKKYPLLVIIWRKQPKSGFFDHFQGGFEFSFACKMACLLNNCHSFGLTNLGDHSKWPPKLGQCETFVKKYPLLVIIWRKQPKSSFFCPKSNSKITLMWSKKARFWLFSSNNH